MLITKQILVSVFVLGAGVTTLTGCGMTGSLYLPTTPTPSKPAASSPQAAVDVSYVFYS
jgi:predicted small lipoprotein YifL